MKYIICNIGNADNLVMGEWDNFIKDDLINIKNALIINICNDSDFLEPHSLYDFAIEGIGKYHLLIEGPLEEIMTKITYPIIGLRKKAIESYLNFISNNKENI